MPRRPLRSACLAAALLLLAGAAGCGRKSEQAGEGTAPVEAPVPAPRGLLAEIAVATPSSSWSRLQRGVGGPLGLLPATFGGALLSTLGVDVTLASEIDPVAPVHGVVASPEGVVSWAVALRLADPRHARAVWLTGDAPPLTARPRGTLVELTPRTRPDGDVTLGLTPGGWLLVASSGAALEALGPYAAVTLAARPPPAHAAMVTIPDGAFAESLGPRLDAAWTEARRGLLERDAKLRAEHGGREPDFGDPKAIVAAADAAIAPRIALAREVGKATLTLDVGEEDATLEARFTPRDPRGGLAAHVERMKPLPPDAVGLLPARALVAFAHRVQDADADAGAESSPAALALLDVVGARLSDAHRKQLRGLVEDERRAGLDVVAGAASATEPRAAFVYGRAADPAALMRAFDAAGEVAAASPFKEMLHLASASSRTEDVEGLGKASVTTFTRAPAAAARRRPARDAGAPPAETLAIARIATAEAVLVGAGDDGIGALRWGRAPEHALATSAPVTRLLRGAREASTVVVAQPLLVDPGRAPADAAPLTVVLGRADGGPRVEVALTFALLREASRYLLGF